MSAWTCRQSGGKAAQKIVPPRPRIPWWKGPGADSEEKHEPASDIDTAGVDSLKVLDPEGPIREADIGRTFPEVRLVPLSDACTATNCISIRSPRRRARVRTVKFRDRAILRS